jgi:glutaminyl-peptide cyclotransferase
VGLTHNPGGDVRGCEGAKAPECKGARVRRYGTNGRAVLGATILASVLFSCSADADHQPTAEGRAGTVATAPSHPRTPAQSSTPVAPSPPRTAAQGSVLPVFDSARAYEHLRRQVAFGPRPAGSAALAQCREYIVSQLKAAGIAVREESFDVRTPLGQTRLVNLVATIPGRRSERIALASHYDTKLFREFRFVGASDGASSTAALLELGRILKARQNEFTIELLFFDGEEAVVDWNRNNDNTYGSRHYVEAAQKSGTLKSLRALVLLDMIGDRNLNIRRDSNSTGWLNDIVWASAARLGYRSNFLNEETTIDDDHMPFVRAGIPSIDIIDLDYPAWHTAQDDLDRVSARSLQIVGEVVLDALPQIERRLANGPARQ